jgi:hypothetical protein
LPSIIWTINKHNLKVKKIKRSPTNLTKKTERLHTINQNKNNNNVKEKIIHKIAEDILMVEDLITAYDKYLFVK